MNTGSDLTFFALILYGRFAFISLEVDLCLEGSGVLQPFPACFSWEALIVMLKDCDSKCAIFGTSVAVFIWLSG